MQVTGTNYEWSDGTRFDYQTTISESEKTTSSDKPEAGCVLVTPAGLWVKSSCRTVAEGAICYTTNISSASQSKTLIALVA